MSSSDDDVGNDSSDSYSYESLNLDDGSDSSRSDDWDPFDGYEGDEKSQSSESTQSAESTDEPVVQPPDQLLRRNRTICSDCDQLYNSATNKPYALMCSHLLCKRCIIAQLSRTGWTLKCLLCTRKTELPLRRRFSTLRLDVDALNEAEKSKGGN